MKASFGPTVIAGLGGAALAAWAGSNDWVKVTAPGPMPADLNDSPGTTGLALVALAAWGVVLVTRGLVRRLVAALAGLAGIGVIVTFFGHAGTDALGRAVESEVVWGETQRATTPWPYLALLGAVVTIAAAVAGVRLAPRWPEMGRKYDAPAAAEPAAKPLEEQSTLDVWKSLDEGRDPTTGDQ
ncbi:putative membrane protein (TIGR02234 family) [Nocardioides albertanoniae]|uniref:Putative membrane protein (TIGR02234 family) n=1 Tax=Nocardioides albertanoniae TaxID=1175486 RepID=A0A543A9E8_9ACTN|nr:Trp biosynthesis-associated membrane protein [Nocardioides albertanoniae]TQL69191.1 putative membrane protein (TIGR02234 family) [Nocardioides albertanoniae]